MTVWVVNMKKVELLAPVGSIESLNAAINAGCDAVYLGGYMFGARQFAPNFSNDEIKELIKTCHIYGVKVYITVNTLIKEHEVPTFIEFIDFLHRNNVDAVIMQDLGMIDLARKLYPKLEIHASTQLHIHNLEGVKFCEKLGLKRVVLARETDIGLVKNIRMNTNIELELFVHGALCVSYSGQCLMSSLIGGRSGNRGACAGTCRLPYQLLSSDNKKLNHENYVLSMKDLCTLEHIQDLIESGIDSFKIEGRMKRPEYVYLVVSLYRKAIDSYYETGKVFIDDHYLTELKKIFNREFTCGFLFNELNNNITNSFRPNHMGIEIAKVIEYNKNKLTIKLLDELNIGDGIRIIDYDIGCVVTNIYRNKEKVNSAKRGDTVTIFLNEKIKTIKSDSKVVKTTDIKQIKLLKDKINKISKKIAITGKIILQANKPLYLNLSDGKNNISITGISVQEANNAPLDNDKIEKQINKLGDTPFALEKLEIIKDENIYVNNRDLNEIRRNAVEQLLNLRIYKTNYLKDSYNIDVPDFLESRELNVLLEDSKFYDKIKKHNFDYIYSDDVALFKNNDSRLIFKVPRVNYDMYNFNYPLMIGELGSLSYTNKKVGDFSLNVFNSYAVAFLHSVGLEKVTLSYELTKSEIKDIITSYKDRYLKKPNLEVVVYGREEMMISKFSLNSLYQRNFLYLVDRINHYYPVKEKNGLMYIYNYQPRIDNYINDYYEMGINSVRINIFDEQDLSWYLSKIRN